MAEIYKVDASFDHGFFKGTSCAFGVFDGVHRGHRYLLDCARSTAAAAMPAHADDQLRCATGVIVWA